MVTKAEAKALGLKRYSTGKPCKRGHIAERQTSNKTCVECSRINDKARYEANPEKKRLRSKAWIAAHPDKKRAADKAWRETNPDRKRSNDRAWWAANRDRGRAGCKERYAANRTKMAAYFKARYAADPERFKAESKAYHEANPEKVMAWSRNRKARKRSALGRHTAADIANIRKKQRDRCAYCRFPLHGAGHVDHITPLSKGGTNWPRNLQLACVKCNTSKQDKPPEQYAREIGLLL
jgi:5-methylcytosine-specific restriction endonuclease McrA